MTNFWGTAAVPTLVPLDIALYELGTAFIIRDTITVTAVRVWSPPGSQLTTVPRKGRVWNSLTGTLLGSVDMPAELPDGWSEHPLLVPIVLHFGDEITVAVTTQNGYGFQTLSGVAIDSVDGFVRTPSVPGRWTDTVGARPSNQSNSAAHYGIDMVWEAGDTTGASQAPVLTVAVAQDQKPTPSTVSVTFSTDKPADVDVDWGDGTTANSASSPASHVYANAGLYAIQVVATDIDGLFSAKSVAVEVDPAAVVYASGMSPSELRMQRSLTKMFIEADKEDIVLEPFSREANGSGGFRLVSQPPLAPQVMRLIPLSNTAFERNTLDGKAVTPNFMLMGEWDCEMARGNRFTLDGKRYEVVHVQEKRDYQTKGETVYLGDA